MPGFSKNSLIFLVSISLNYFLSAYAEELIIKGDNLNIAEKGKRYVLSGNAIVEGEDFILLGDVIEMMSLQDSTLINGDMLILSNSFLLRCNRAIVYKDSEQIRLYNISGISLKMSLDPHQYLSYDRERLFESFNSKMSLRARYLRQVTRDRFYAENIYYTICDCKEDNTWELYASMVYYEKNGYMLSLSNVFYFQKMPIFYMPAILLPVGERRSGFLLPEIGFNSTVGYSIRNAYYQTITDIADATLYLTLMSRKGRMYSLEFRYKPLINLYGRTMFSFVKDSPDSPFDERFSLKNEHRFDYHDRLVLALSTNIVSDSSYMSDFLFDFWERNTEYSLSKLYMGYMSGDMALRIEFDYYQNFKQRLVLEDNNFFSDIGMNESQRFPYLQIDLLPVRLFSGGDVALNLSYVNYYSFYSDFDEFDYHGNPLKYGDNLRSIVGFQRFTLALPIHYYFSIADFLKINQDLDSVFRIYQIPGRQYEFSTSGYELRASLSFFRDYEKFTHYISPELEYKHLFYVEYTKDWNLYDGRTVLKDEKDNYLKSRYLLFSLRNFIYKNGNISNQVVEVDIAEGYQHIVRGGFTPLILKGFFNLDYFRTSAELYYYWDTDESFYDTSLQSILSDARGDSLLIRYQRFKNYMENPKVIFNEDFEYLLPAYYDLRMEDIFLSLTLKITRELLLGYFITYSIEQKRLLFHGGNIGFVSRCNCLNASFTAVMYTWYELPAFITTFNLGGNL